METCNPLQGFGSHAKGEKRKTLFFENNIRVVNEKLYFIKGHTIML
jgi:hypothetical protein